MMSVGLRLLVSACPIEMETECWSSGDETSLSVSRFPSHSSGPSRDNVLIDVLELLLTRNVCLYDPAMCMTWQLGSPLSVLSILLSSTNPFHTVIYRL